MSFDADRLYELLPAFHRIRDAEKGGPLRELIAILAEQIAILEEDLDQLYDDQFIETCAEWVVPYIGDLVGARGITSIRGARYSQRAEVADTISFRRRKGTASMLEQLAHDVTQRDTAVVEYFRLLATTQSMHHIRLGNQAFASVRERDREYANTPFDPTAHNAEMRRIATGGGKYNIPNIGIHLFPIQSFPIELAEPFPVDGRRFKFDPLGRDIPLYNARVAEETIEHLATPANVPMAISRRIFDAHKSDFYPDSVAVRVDGHDVPVENVRICDLSDTSPTTWQHVPPIPSLPSAMQVTVDPQLGRFAISQPAGTVRVTYHYGFSDAMGGGAYDRPAEADRDFETIAVGEGDSIAAALGQLAADWAAGGTFVNGIVELTASAYFIEPIVVSIPAGKSIEIRAASQRRPVVVLTGMPTVFGEPNSSFALSGVVVAGQPLVAPATLSGRTNALRTFRVTHCTLAPRQPDAIKGTPTGGAPVRLELMVPDARLEIRSSITAAVVASDEAEALIEDSIVDAGGAGNVAYDGGGVPGAPLEIADTTIIGRVSSRRITLASNTIFHADGTLPLYTEQVQKGCVRFSYVPPGARVPRRYRCQPTANTPVAPAFRSLDFGDPRYASLARSTSPLIRAGADDRAEMGAFHDLYQPQREANLRARLDEYLRFSLEAGIFEFTG